MQIDFEKLRQRMEDDKHLFYLIVAGSRGFDIDGAMSYADESSEDGFIVIDNYTVFSQIMDKLLAPLIEKFSGVVIVSGGANGPDKMAKRYAMEKGHTYKEFAADWTNEGRSAGMKRNRRMYLYTEMRPNKASLLFWDGESRGTRNNFLCAYDFRINVLCYNFLQKRWMTKEEIKEVQAECDAEAAAYY